MTRVLLVTVGGSPDPILEAVKIHKPDELIFICSAPPCDAPSVSQVIGKGEPCQHYGPNGEPQWRSNLVSQLDLVNFRPDLQILEIPDPDDLVDCHRRIQSFCNVLKHRFIKLELIGDYSGGTKTMSAALTLVLVDQGAEISLVSGKRRDLNRIIISEGSRSIAVGPLKASRLLKEQLPLLLQTHFYDRALQAITELRSDHEKSLDQIQLKAIKQLEDCLPVLMLWDSFRWEEALEQAKTTILFIEFPALIDWWQRVVSSRLWLDHQQPLVAVTGYELVQDLLLNAQRRGCRGWYDDAVARLYRTLELLAQTYIQLEKGYDHQTFWDNEQIHRDCQQWNVKRGVGGLYWWLRHVEGATGLAGAASSQWHQIRDLLDARNQSLLGHGLRPVARNDWQSLQQRVSNLVSTALTELGCTQGAHPHQLPGISLLEVPAAIILLGGNQ